MLRGNGRAGYARTTTSFQRPRLGLSALMLVCAVGWIGMATTAWELFAVALVEIGIGIAADVLDRPAVVPQSLCNGRGNRLDQLLRRRRWR